MFHDAIHNAPHRHEHTQEHKSPTVTRLSNVDAHSQVGLTTRRGALLTDYLQVTTHMYVCRSECYTLIDHQSRAIDKDRPDVYKCYSERSTRAPAYTGALKLGCYGAEQSGRALASRTNHEARHPSY